MPCLPALPTAAGLRGLNRCHCPQRLPRPRGQPSGEGPGAACAPAPRCTHVHAHAHVHRACADSHGRRLQPPAGCSPDFSLLCVRLSSSSEKLGAVTLRVFSYWLKPLLHPGPTPTPAPSSPCRAPDTHASWDTPRHSRPDRNWARRMWGRTDPAGTALGPASASHSRLFAPEH